MYQRIARAAWPCSAAITIEPTKAHLYSLELEALATILQELPIDMPGVCLAHEAAL